ncbi:28S ribosomal protein S35, mitochondrial-like [Penaeus japonicus]|uniref:28S ribosomal protein S35, mitochondrial-like n=1 Tax=Penaeus japonicus TaxID=27405 RepID=UPI001C70B822|nr:28S ribosomal protein S35, mitochondrial-like [Penaeus japonicus]
MIPRLETATKMSLKCRLFSDFALQQLFRSAPACRLHISATNQAESKAIAEDEEFRTLELGGKKMQRRAQRIQREMPTLPPRYKRQATDQDWGTVWPAARSFHPATVPLAVRQGYPAKGQAPPDKWGNAELMKIPNFLHLTPPVIERQCEALKKFCTPWPAGLENTEKQEKNFPVTMAKSSYVHSSPSIRDPKSRIVTLKVNLQSLDLDMHARDKLLRLVGNHYDPATDCVTLVADRCPLSQQNADYCRYLLTVLYNEAVKTEPWEHEKEVLDYEHYIWEGSPSEAALKALASAMGDSVPEAHVKEYRDAVTELHNEGGLL